MRPFTFTFVSPEANKNRQGTTRVFNHIVNSRTWSKFSGNKSKQYPIVCRVAYKMTSSGLPTFHMLYQKLTLKHIPMIYNFV